MSLPFGTSYAHRRAAARSQTRAPAAAVSCKNRERERERVCETHVARALKFQWGNFVHGRALANTEIATIAIAFAVSKRSPSPARYLSAFRKVSILLAIRTRCDTLLPNKSRMISS